jgi:hypothetical protein
MKKAFLDSLVGLEVSKAEELVLAEGHLVELVPEECNAITSQARGNTVILWQKDGKITNADAGDPLELDIKSWENRVEWEE